MGLRGCSILEAIKHLKLFGDFFLCSLAVFHVANRQTRPRSNVVASQRGVDACQCLRMAY